jgi:hypothetical protein
MCLSNGEGSRVGPWRTDPVSSIAYDPCLCADHVSIDTMQQGVQRGDRSHHRFDRSGRSRNPTRGNVGFTRGLSSAGARSTSELVSRPPKSSAWPSWIFVGLLMRRGRVTRRGNMGNPSHVQWEAPALRTVHPSRSAESPSERAVQGVTETAPPRDKTLPVGRELVLMKGRAFLPLLTVPQGRAGDA